jgi:hypothetical protein
MQSISKIGRNYRANNKLELRLGGRWKWTQKNYVKY